MSMSKPSFAGPYEPMEVTRKQDDEDGSSHIEPPLDQAWSDLDQLRWLAGVVEADHGLLIRITTGSYYSDNRPVPNSYGLSFLGHSIGPIVGFHAAWRSISDLGLGFGAGRRECERNHT